MLVVLISYKTALLLVTFGPGLHYLAHHAVPVLVDADHLKLVGGARAKVVNLNFPGVWRIYRKLNPVGHPGVFFTVPDIKEKGKWSEAMFKRNIFHHISDLESYNSKLDINCFYFF